jgi:16S rRNA (adenine1518-N6/adenine1519-N6)-dimethyltransferase
MTACDFDAENDSKLTKLGILPSTIRHPPSVPAMKSENHFKLLVKTAFNQRRKMLRNGVRALFDEEFLKNEIFNKRAEQLSVEDFADLTFKMK